MSTLSFKTFSGGTVTFDLDTCRKCETKACVVACSKPNLACVIELRDNVPALRVSAEEAARGACIECLACELACQSDGIGGMRFELPMPEFDALVADMRKRGIKPGFDR